MGFDTSDDAGVYRLAPDLALVQTVDFFTPIVDDPYTFGQIAATNALSDIYAMGARPLTALNIVAFPIHTLSGEVLLEILRGGAQKAEEAGVAILGGHTVDDCEPKFGMAVTGTVHPDRILRNAGARIGDRLVLTKPIGTGILATAAKRDRIDPEALAEAIGWMSTLNDRAAQAALEVQVDACTDITGFGLLGHLREMLRASAVGALLAFDAVPLLDLVHILAREGIAPGGTRRNLAYLRGELEVVPGLPDEDLLILADAQTSGGLLMAVDPAKRDFLLQALQRNGAQGWDIGEIVGEPGIAITL